MSVLSWLGTFISGGVVFSAVKAIYDYKVNVSQQKAKAKFLALQLVHLLDGYALDCVSRLMDGRNYDRSDGNIGRQFVSIPEFPELPKSENYTLMDHDLVERLWSLPADRANAMSLVSVEWDMSGPEEAYALAGSETFIIVDKVFDLAKELYAKYEITPRSKGDEDWDPTTYVKTEVEGILKRRKDRLEAAMEAAFGKPKPPAG